MRNRPWSKRIHDAVKDCTLVWWNWRQSGSHMDPTADTVKNMKMVKRILWKDQQRQEAIKIRREKMVEIMNSKFFKLVNNQRKASNTQLQTLIVGSREYETTDEVREGWAEHFERLATLSYRHQFHKQYKRLVCLDFGVIELLCSEETSPIIPVTEAEVTSALKRLNNNKAMDIMGITSKHFKLAGQDVHEYLTCFLSFLIVSWSVAATLKEGILT